MFPRFEHAVGEAEMSFVREVGVGCSRFISRGDQVASRGQNGRPRPNPSIDDHRNWAAAHDYNLWRPINSNDLSAVPLDWS
jgi:hypothetical protein